MTDQKDTHSVEVGRYLLHRQIARGGMATIHIARLRGDEGFSRIVAAKRLLPEFAEDSDFVAMFMDEARIASKVHHRNVVPVLDLVTTSDDVMLVQEYVHGVPLHWLLRTSHQGGKHIPVKVAVALACDVLAGLHAAHETVDEMGTPLNIVHRDVSPQNVMVATDGSARLLDFGVAKATMAAHVTRDGTFKGKLAYSAPEQLRGHAVRQSDIYALSVVLWELLVGHRMHGTAQGEAELVATIMTGTIPTVTEALASENEWGALTSDDWKNIAAIDAVISKGMAVKVDDRYPTALAMQEALMAAITPATPAEVSAWLKSLGREFLEGRDKILQAEEASWRKTIAQGTTPSRLTPVPGTVRRSMTNIEPVRAQSHPPAPASMTQNAKTKVIIGVLGALVVLLGAGFVIATRGNGTSAAPASEAAKIPPSDRQAQVPAATAAPAPAAAVAAPVAPAHEPAAPPETTTTTTTAPAAAPVEVAKEPPREAVKDEPVKTVRRTPPVRQIQRPIVKQVKAPEPAPAPAPAPAAAAPAPAPDKKDDCNPPYYFQGSKKIFKPNCI